MSEGDIRHMSDQVVVAAAIVRDSPAPMVLAARRILPPELSGQWEFPGGKVGPDESDAEALVREIREEIGVEIAVGAVLGESSISDGVVLRLLEAELLTGEEEARFDHDEVRWFAARDLPGVTWLPADRAL